MKSRLDRSFVVTQTFQEAISWSPVEPGTYRSSIDETWFQGRGAFGGVLAGAIIRAMTDVIDSPRHRLRALNTQFCAPVDTEPARLDVEIVRRGSSVINTRARITQDGAPRTTASATFGADRDSEADFQRTSAPDVPLPQEVEPAPESPLFPDFSQYYEYRFCVGNIPYSGSDEATVGGWCRLRDADRPVDTIQAAALLDIWPPAILSTMSGPTAAATVFWQLVFDAVLPLDDAAADDFVLVDSSSDQATGGYAEQRSSLWSHDGRRLAQSQQLVAIFG